VVADQARAVGTQCVPRREATADAIGSDQIGLLHAERLEDVLAEVALQGSPGHVLDDLAERGKPVIAVDVPHAGFCDQAQTAPVVLGEGGHRPSELHHLSKGRHERSREMDALGEPGGIGQQMTHRRGPVCGVRGNQLVRDQIVVRGSIEIKHPLLPQLHHGDRGERLRERPDAEDGVFGYRRVRRDIGESVTVEELQSTVTNDPDGETDGWMPVEDPTDFGIQL
jgi:hypothetical protein